MLRELSNQELAIVSGGAPNDITQVIPDPVPGWVLVGWTQQMVGMNKVEWTEYVGFWGRPVYHVDQSPIYEIKPVWAPAIVETTTTVVYN